MTAMFNGSTPDRAGGLRPVGPCACVLFWLGLVLGAAGADAGEAPRPDAPSRSALTGAHPERPDGAGTDREGFSGAVAKAARDEAVNAILAGMASRWLVLPDAGSADSAVLSFAITQAVRDRHGEAAATMVGEALHLLSLVELAAKSPHAAIAVGAYHDLDLAVQILEEALGLAEDVALRRKAEAELQATAREVLGKLRKLHDETTDPERRAALRRQMLAITEGAFGPEAAEELVSGVPRLRPRERPDVAGRFEGWDDPPRPMSEWADPPRLPSSSRFRGGDFAGDRPP